MSSKYSQKMQYISLGYKNAFYLWCCHSNIQADEQTRACEHVTGGWGMVGKNFRFQPQEA